MSNAALQWTKFREEVAQHKRVFTFEEGGDWLVFPVNGQGVMPFWSTRSRAERVRKYHPSKFEGFEILEIGLDHFLNKVLTGMDKDGFHVGVNWAGKRMIGYDILPTEVAESLRAMLDLYSKRNSADS